MSEELPADSNFDKYLAINALRENMFLNHPSAYSILDNAEMLPGSAGRAVGTALQDVAPSLGIIRSNPEEREKQIQDAITRIKATRGHQNVGSEMLRGAGTMAASAVIPTLLMEAAFGKHSPIKAPAAFGKLFSRVRPAQPRIGNWFPGSARVNSVLSKLDVSKARLPRFNQNAASPISGGDLLPTTNFKGFKRYGAGNLLDNLGQNAAGMGLMGATAPLIADRKQFTDDQLDRAADVLRQKPYLTSLPGGDLVAATNVGTPHSRLRNMLTGAMIGGISTPISMVAGHTLRAPFEYGRRALQGRTPKPLSQYFSKFKKPSHYIAPTAIVAGLGALTGLLQPTGAPDVQQQQ